VSDQIEIHGGNVLVAKLWAVKRGILGILDELGLKRFQVVPVAPVLPVGQSRQSCQC
jgi:hypothetical protein